MLQLFRRGETPTPLPVDDAAIIELYVHPRPPSGQAWLRTNFVTSLDGSVQGPDGRSGSINTPSDRRVFALQRALTDAVLVGAQTVRAEGYRAVALTPWQREIRSGYDLRPVPTLVIITRTLDLKPALAVGGGPVMIITTEEHTDSELEPFLAAGAGVTRVGRTEVDLVQAVSLLAGQGSQRLLCEGGPRLHHALLAAGLVDEICLTISPITIGGPGLRMTNGPLLADPVDFELMHLLTAADGALFSRYVRTPGRMGSG